MSLPIFTIGHSTRSMEEFRRLLVHAEISVVVDVRRLPGSNRYPQFNQDPLIASLAEVGIGYSRYESLAGRRGRDRQIPEDVNGFWENRSFHNYADYALTDQFHAGLNELIQRGQTERLALMCSEAVWWRCHRRLIADHLMARGEDVRHLMGEDRIDVAHFTAGAVVDPSSQQVTYPAG